MNPRLQGLSPTVLSHLDAAGEALDSGRRDDATQQLQLALAVYPDHPEVLRMQAGLFSLQNRHGEAIRTMQRAIRQRPGDALYHNTMGTLLGSGGDYELATRALEHACQLDPLMPVAWYNRGVMLTRCVRHEEAIAALKQAVILAPEHWNARALLADLLRTRGFVEESEHEYRRLLAARPITGTAWWGLADLKTAFSAEDIRRMEVAAKDPHASIADSVATRFALAKALEDGHRYADSLNVLAEANAMARRQKQWDASAFNRDLEAIRTAFSASHATSGVTMGSEVIFITSLPRSGSTLVEQIFASHSSVEGAGELPDLPMVINEESRRAVRRFQAGCLPCCPPTGSVLVGDTLSAPRAGASNDPCSLTNCSTTGCTSTSSARCCLGHTSLHAVVTRLKPVFQRIDSICPTTNTREHLPMSHGSGRRSIEQCMTRQWIIRLTSLSINTSVCCKILKCRSGGYSTFAAFRLNRPACAFMKQNARCDHRAQLRYPFRCTIQPGQHAMVPFSTRCAWNWASRHGKARTQQR